MMGSHEATMRGLMRDRVLRGLKLEVGRLSLPVLRAELEERRLSTEGNLVELRDRLTRAVIREERPGLAVPWYLHDQLPVTPLIPRLHGVESEQGTEESAGGESDTSSFRRWPAPPPINVVADVHAENSGRRALPRSRVSVITPVTTATTTVVTTTQARITHAGINSVAGRVIEPEGGHRLTTRDFGLPRMAVRETLSRYRGPEEEYFHYAAQMVRDGLPQRSHELREEEPHLRAAAAPRVQAPRSPDIQRARDVRVATPTVSAAAGTNNHNETAWFTPAGVTPARRGGLNHSQNSLNSSRSGRSQESYENEVRVVDRERRRKRAQESRSRAGSQAPRTADRNLQYSSDGEERFSYAFGAAGEGERRFDRRVIRENERVNRREIRRRQTPTVLEWDHFVPGFAPGDQTESEVDSFQSRRDARDERPSKRRETRIVKPERRGDSRDRRDATEYSRRESELSNQKLQTVKILRSWGIPKYAGEEKSEDPEEFLEQIEECRDGSGISDAALLAAIPCCLTKKASRWYRTARIEIRSWSEFCRKFRNHFMRFYDREDLMDDLQRRTQAEGEKITSYLSSFKYIVSRFRNPPSEREQVELAYRKLHPKYRDAIGDKVIESLDDIERYGRIYERKKDLDLRYLPPPTAEKMRVPGAAYTGPRKPKVAAVQEDEEGVAGVEGAAGGKKSGKGKGKNKAVNKGGAQTQANEASADSDCTPNKQPLSYAAALQNSGRSSPPRADNSQQAGKQQPRDNNVRNQPNKGSSGNKNAQIGGRAASPRGDVKQGVYKLGANDFSSANDAGRRIGARGAEFVGACYTCQNVGHRASECPEIVCFRCSGKGHTSRQCPSRDNRATANENKPRSRDRCQGCDRPDYTVKTCPSCAFLFTNLGNAQRGARK